MSLARSEDSPQRFYELVAHGILARDEACGRSTSYSLTEIKADR
jgi:hypothetical protein